MRTDGWQSGSAESSLRVALERTEAAQAGAVPPFSQVRAHLARQSEPMGHRRRSLSHSTRLAGALVLAQLRVVPGLVVPIMLVMAVAAVLAALLAAGMPGAVGTGGVMVGELASGGPFVPVLLTGAALTVTMAVGRAEHDAVSLATSLGPRVVTLARLALVLGLDATAGLVASVALGAFGLGDVPALLVGWLPPLALVAGLASFVAIWAAPWAGAVCGLALVPLASPAMQGVSGLVGSFFGLGGIAAGFRGALGPTGMVALGAVLLALTVVTSRRALLAREPGAE